MKYFDLDRDEEKLVRDFEGGRLRTAAGFRRRGKVYQRLAQRTLEKAKNINIRVSEKILSKLKARAVEEGLPYQTLAASVLHRFANGSEPRPF